MPINSVSPPLFGKLGEQAQLDADGLQQQIAERMEPLHGQMSEIQFQQQLSAMPVDELVMQLGREQGTGAIVRAEDKSGRFKKAPDIMPIPTPTGQIMAVPLAMLLGGDEKAVETFKAEFGDGVGKALEKAIEQAQRRAEVVREELESRITIAEAFGRDEVPYMPGAKSEDGEKAQGIEIKALRRLLDHTA